ncbi:MAG: glycosyltransferase family 4 protein [Actinobacteria bacterium]|nr:glycosyltransferase family 4 protein [Actinomycetota bacterium]
MKRVLFVTHSYYLRDTRPRRHAEALSEAGYDVDVLCARDAGEPATEVHRGVTIHRLPSQRKRGGKARYVFEYVSFIVLALLAVARMHLRKRYALVWIFSVPNSVVFAGLVPRLMGAPVVLDVRDPMPEFFESRFGIGEGSPWIRLLLRDEKISCRFASHVATVHETLRETLLRTGVKPERTSVVMNAPDLTHLAQAAAWREQRDPADRTLLYAGTVAARYGIANAIEAVARLQEEIPGIRLRIVGDGDHVRGLIPLARKLRVSDRVQFDGPVPFTEIPGVIASSWAGVQPHRLDPLMAFSLSTKIIEWCALGLPVVVSGTPAVREYFDETEVWLIEPGSVDDLCERLRAIHKEPDAAIAKANRAREAVLERFDWSREKDRLLSLVATLAK